MEINKQKMEATITFTLPDEQQEFEQASRGGALAGILFDIDQELRSMEKYQNKVQISTGQMREMIREKLEEHGLNFENIIFM